MSNGPAAAHPIILDTDIGTDVDDVVALGLALATPSIDLLAVTTVYVHAAPRARMVRAVLDVAGQGAIPIGVGADDTLLKRDPLYWAGWEGEGLLDDATVDTPGASSYALPHAVDVIVETAMARPGEVTLLAIGPLTNVALALLREPRLATTLHRIVIMGGLVQRRLDQLGQPYSEHNIRCDPEAADVVFQSGAPITLVPLDVTTQVRIRAADLERLSAGGPLAALVADQVRRYLAHVGRDWTNMHDPLALAAIAEPSLLGSQPMRVRVETHGEHTRGQTVATLHKGTETDDTPYIDVALEVDAPRFEQWVLQTLLA